MYFTLYAFKRALFATAEGTLTMVKEILGTVAAANIMAALETGAAAEETVAPEKSAALEITAAPDTTAILDTTPDIMAIPETTPDIMAAPDIRATPETTPDTMAAPNTTAIPETITDTNPDTIAASNTHATPVSGEDIEEQFDNLVKDIDVDVDEEFEELFNNYKRDNYYTDLVGLYFSQPSHTVLKTGNRRRVTPTTPGAGDSLRGTKSVYEILEDREAWRISNPGKFQQSFEDEISFYVKEFDFSFSKPEIKS